MLNRAVFFPSSKKNPTKLQHTNPKQKTPHSKNPTPKPPQTKPTWNNKQNNVNNMMIPTVSFSVLAPQMTGLKIV